MSPARTNATVKIAEGCFLIDSCRHKQLQSTPYNPAVDGMASKNMFTHKFAKEIANTRNVFSEYFEKHGEFGSQERYAQGLPSDWWIGDDFYSTSRVLCIDLLNPKLQDFKIIRGAQEILSKLDNKWMLLIGHDNDFDARGVFVGKPGTYSIWVTSEEIEVYTEREEDIKVLLDSVPKTNCSHRAENK
jgi:hypothetical protein